MAITVFSIRIPFLVTILGLKCKQAQFTTRLCLKIAGRVANSVDPDETPLLAASYLGLNCLLGLVCPNTYGKRGKLSNIDISKNIASRQTEKTVFNRPTSEKSA